MAKLWVGLIAVLLGAALVVAFWSDEGPPAPAADANPGSREDREAPSPRPAGAPVERREVAGELGEAGRAKPEPTAPPAGEPETRDRPPQPEEPRCTLQLRVFDVTTRAPVESFRYDWRQGSDRQSESVAGNAADFEVSPGEGSLLIEADGYQPERRELLSVPDGLPALLVELQLAPRARGAGIELTVRDANTDPVPHLRVDAWRLPEPPPPRPLPNSAPLAPRERPQWARRASEPEGVYELPGIDPGHWLLRVQAVDADGAPRLLQPVLRHVTFTGSEHVPVVVDLVAGALLTLTVVDASERVLGLEVALQLSTGERVLPVDWTATVDGQTRRRHGGLPGPAPATLAHPIPPGTYTLRLSSDDRPQPTSVELWLPAGGHHRQRVVLPSRR